MWLRAPDHIILEVRFYVHLSKGVQPSNAYCTFLELTLMTTLSHIAFIYVLAVIFCNVSVSVRPCFNDYHCFQEILQHFPPSYTSTMTITLPLFSKVSMVGHPE